MHVKEASAGRFLVAVVAACLCLLALASTAAADNYRYKIVPADQVAAKLAVLRLSDLRFATGWTGGPTKPDRTDDDFPCYGKKPKLSDLVVTGDAKSEFKHSAGGALIFTTVSVYRTVEMLETSWRREVQEVDLACARNAIAAEIADAGRLVSFQRLAFPKTGSHTTAFRARVSYKNNVFGLFDIIFFTRGRTGSTFIIGMIGAKEVPAQLPDTEQYLVSMLAARMAAI